jgi:hypothetical protein
MKHVEHKINNSRELDKLLNHLRETTSKIDGVSLIDIYFPKNKNEFILALDCASEAKYFEWRESCPPPAGASDWYEIFLTKEEQFP